MQAGDLCEHNLVFVNTDFVRDDLKTAVVVQHQTEFASAFFVTRALGHVLLPMQGTWDENRPQLCESRRSVPVLCIEAASVARAFVGRL